MDKKHVKNPGLRKRQALCLAGGVLLWAALEVLDGGESVLQENRLIRRQPHGQGEIRYEVLVKGLESREIPVSVLVRDRELSAQEADLEFERLLPELKSAILGENPSLAEVRTDLNLVTSLGQNGIRIRWEMEDSDLIDPFGKISFKDVPESGRETRLRAVMSDGKREAGYEIPVKIWPPAMTKEEKAAGRLEAVLDKLDEEQQGLDCLTLPEEYEGKKLYYRTEQTSGNEMLLVLGVLLAVLCSAKDQMDEREENKKREQQLLLDYSEVVSKLMVFIGAGMTIRSAWEKIVSDYTRSLARGGRKKRYAYEEMYQTACQMQSGMPESQAYGNFGRRCGLQPYLKLGTLLEQNRRTGAKTLKSALELEMVSAFEQRKNLAKRLGEEAGTKLLLPLFLMLGVVMVMIVAPAFMAFY